MVQEYCSDRAIEYGFVTSTQEDPPGWAGKYRVSFPGSSEKISAADRINKKPGPALPFFRFCKLPKPINLIFFLMDPGGACSQQAVKVIVW